MVICCFLCVRKGRDLEIVERLFERTRKNCDSMVVVWARWKVVCRHQPYPEAPLTPRYDTCTDSADTFAVPSLLPPVKGIIFIESPVFSIVSFLLARVQQFFSNTVLLSTSFFNHLSGCLQKSRLRTKHFLVGLRSGWDYKGVTLCFLRKTVFYCVSGRKNVNWDVFIVVEVFPWAFIVFVVPVLIT